MFTKFCLMIYLVFAIASVCREKQFSNHCFYNLGGLWLVIALFFLNVLACDLPTLPILQK